MAQSTDVRIIKISTQADTSDTRKIDRALDDLATAFEDVQDEVRETGTVSDETASKLNSLVNGALLGAGIAVGNFVTNLATDAISDFASDTFSWSEALNELRATTNLTDDEFASLKESAFDLFSNNFGDSVEDITQKLATAQQTTGLIGDELEQVVMQSERWQVFGADFQEGVRASNQLMQNFGVSAEEAGDLITYMFQNAGDPQGELLDTFNEYSSTFAEMGFTAEEFAQVLIDGAEEGIFSYDKLADAGREAGIRLREGISNPAIAQAYDDLFDMTDSVRVAMSDGTVEMIDSYDELVAAMEDGSLSQRAAIEQVAGALLEIEDPLERNRIAAELFGTQFEDLGPGILEAFDGLDDGLTEAEGAFDQMDTQLSQGLGETLESLKRTISVELFKAIEPFLANLVSKLIPAIAGFAKLMKKSVLPPIKEAADEWIPKFSDAIDELVSAIAPVIDYIVDWVSEQEWLLDLLQKFGPKIAIAAGIVLGLVGAFSAVSIIIGVVTAALALLASPIVLIIAGLAALMLAYEENFMGIRDVVDDAVVFLGEAFDTIVNFITGLVSAFEEGGLAGVADFFKTNVIDPLVAQISAYIGSGQAWDDIKSFGSSLLDGLVAGLSFAADWFLTNVVIPLGAQIATYVGSGQAWDDISAFGSSLLDALSAGLDIALNAATLIYDNVIAPLAAQALEYVTSGEAWDNLKSLASAYINLLKFELDIFSQAATLIYDNIIKPIADQALEYVSSGEAWDNIKAIATGLLGLLAESLDIALNWATFIFDNIIKPLADQALEYVSSGELWDNLTTLATSLIEQAKTTLTPGASWFFDTFLQPLIDEVSNIDTTGILAAIGTVAQSIIDEIVSVIGGGVDAVETAIKSALNAAIPDNVSVDLPSITVPYPSLSDPFRTTRIGGGTISFDIPNPFPGYASGTPFTGFGSLNEVAGMVHRREAVVPAGGMRVFPDPNGLRLSGALGQGMKLDVTLELDGEVLLNKVIDLDERRAP